MLSLPYTVAWYAFLLVVLWLLQRLTHWMTQLNIFTLFIGFLVLRHGITVPFDHTVNQWYAGIAVSPQAYVRFYTSLVLMWVCLLVSITFARLLLGSVRLNPHAFQNAMRLQPMPAGVNWFFLVVVMVCVGLIVVYQLRFDTSLTSLLTGQLSSADYREMRDTYGEATHYSAGLGSHLASIARFGLMPGLVGVLYFLSRHGRGWRIMFIVVLALNLIVGLLSGQKGASVFLLVTLSLAYYYRSGQLKLRLQNWRIWASVAGALFAITLLYRLQYPAQNLGWAWRATTYRLTSEADRCLQLYYEIYPDVQPFMHGTSSGLVNTILGVEASSNAQPERFIATYYLGPDYLNTWNAAYIGVAWADFGYYGVIFESLFVGGLLYAYARWFRNARKTALVMGVQVGLMMSATRLSEVGLTANLLSFGLLSGFLVYALVHIISVAGRSHSRLEHSSNANIASCS